MADRFGEESRSQSSPEQEPDIDMAAPFFVTDDVQKLTYGNHRERMHNIMQFFRPGRGKGEKVDLIMKLRTLIIADLNQCTLCSVQEWVEEGSGDDHADTHRIDACYYQNHSHEASIWLNAFREYNARVDGPGARCCYCRFPDQLCWRTLHRQMLDDKYGNETEAKEKTGKPYPDAPCNWLKPILEFIAACMVAEGKIEGTGLSLVGATALHYMGWEDWKGLEENGPDVLRPWLEEADSIQKLRCPRLLTLYWLLASVRHVDMDLDLDSERDSDSDFEMDLQDD
ncbi:uncharacterized protein FPRO_16095 [Fusarium proliferatum ET1]|uniref:Uncharacterized protein n=1 Tax=Fusarium proliferatum (strain ET1) TaxID=1227346 RepID=A0A1L7WB98_FUSPR|nr:uncharacterized protein FPRO_16095 [Fusarium proliferatum ET1]CZR49889.1 uncharacterized protein FPRO_16095 [Fusarium proliferatum ET1]